MPQWYYCLESHRFYSELCLSLAYLRRSFAGLRVSWETSLIKDKHNIPVSRLQDALVHLITIYTPGKTKLFIVAKVASCTLSPRLFHWIDTLTMYPVFDAPPECYDLFLISSSHQRCHTIVWGGASCFLSISACGNDNKISKIVHLNCAKVPAKQLRAANFSKKATKRFGVLGATWR